MAGIEGYFKAAHDFRQLKGARRAQARVVLLHYALYGSAPLQKLAKAALGPTIKIGRPKQAGA